MLFRFFLQILKPVQTWIGLHVMVALIWAFDTSFRPYVVKFMINDLMQAKGIPDSFSYLIPVYFGMALLIFVAFRFYDFAWMNLNNGLKEKVSMILVERTMKHSMGLFQNQFSGNLANKIKEVMSDTPDLIRMIIDRFFAQGVAILIATCVMYSISWKFACLFLVWGVVFVGFSYFSFENTQKLCVECASERSKLMGHLVDILGNILNIHLFSSQKTEQVLFHQRIKKYVHVTRLINWRFLRINAWQSSSFVIYQVISFWFLIKGFKKGEVTAGDFALLFSISMSVVNNMWTLSQDFLKVTEMLSSIKEALKVLLQPYAIEDKKDAKELDVKQGHIVFDNVTFAYPNKGSIFKDQNITILKGQRVGLVGYSGGGKSTFINLILRLYDLQKGQILIDGQNIQEVTQESLHNSVAVIPQDPSLFHRSIMENIRYGRPDASDEEVILASQKACAHDFIQNMGGYHVHVGERGVKLSGGQRQRIALARAILKNAPILILDEATSQLDSITENLIQESLWNIMEGKTALVIAHRLSTLLHMDRILVFDKGKIVEDGSHKDLLKKEGLYKKLWATQMNGFLGDKEILSPFDLKKTDL